MASAHKRKDSDKTASGKAKVAWQGYVNYSPTDEDKKSLAAALSSQSWNEIAYLEEVLLNGYKLSITWDAYRSCFLATLFCQNANDPNGGWCLTARAARPEQAQLRVLWIDYHAFKGESWISSLERGGKNDEW